MILSKIWWTRVANAARFLDDACDALRCGRSIVLNFDRDIPWMDTMIDEIEQECSRMTDVKMFVRLEHDSKSNVSPGEILLKRFCSESERARYWPTKYRSYEHFLSTSKNSTIKHRFVCVTDIEGSAADKWIISGNRYLENFKEDEEHGVFILVTKNANIKNANGFEFLRYSDYITDYDCMMLCLNILSPLPCGRLKKLYLAEIASNIADNNVEIAGELIQQNSDFAEDPEDIIKRFFYENDMSVFGLDDKIKNAVWEAQIRLVFPQIETFRRNWIQKYEKSLKKYLPISIADGSRLDKISDLEINHLCHLNVNASPSEKKSLTKMRDARNVLAHIGTLDNKDLLDLKIF